MRDEELAAEYALHRDRLTRIAYAVLGSRTEAEDVVSECWLRLCDADARESIRDVLGWATVAVSRAALDVLRSARVRREQYVGPWLPEPLVGAGTDDPADRVTLDEQVHYALMVVLEQLTPAERTAWVLHDLFALPFDEVGAVVGRSTAAVRQLAHRARRHVADAAPRVKVDASTHDRVVAAFLQAADGGDLAGLMALLDPQVTLTSDGGGVVNAARRPVMGADRVARFLLGITGRPGAASYEPVGVNGRTGLRAVLDGRLLAVVSFTLDRGLVTRVDIVMAPAKLPG